MLITTLMRELLVSKPFERTPEADLIMDSEEAVSAFARAGQPNGILSGVYAFYAEQASRMIRPGDHVLDLGCGPAHLLRTVASVNQQARFTGIDYSSSMIAKAAESLRQTDTRNVNFAIDDMTRLATIASRSIDVVLSSMAMHHLPHTEDLRRSFEAVERVLKPNGRVFIADFGRLRSAKSIEYFVRRAIPHDEPKLELDYRASLHAAFSKQEFHEALTPQLAQRLTVYSTAVSPMMVVVMTPRPVQASAGRSDFDHVVKRLPRRRRSDYRQLRLSLRLGGMPAK